MSITQSAEARRAALGTPGWLEPELATLTKDRFSDPAWLYERKLDGERCIAYRSGDQVLLMTPNRQDVSGSFSRLQRRLGVRQPDEALRRQVPVYYYVFDLLYAEGRDIRPQPLRERKRLLRELLSFGDPLRYTEHREGDGEEYFDQACQQGWEGLIAKRADAPYRSGRTRDWLKFKCQNSQEFLIGGYTDPKGSRTHFGALLLGYYDQDGRLAYAGKVGTGFSDATLASLGRALRELERGDPAFDRDLLPRSSDGGPPRSGVHWVEPRLVAQVGFTEWTGGGQLRHPRFLGLREDKVPASVVREMA